MSIGQLGAALAKAQGAMEAATKDAKGNYGKYATLAAIWDACRKPLSDNGLAVIQMPSVEGNTVKVRTVLVHESGEQIEDTCEAVAADPSPQKVGGVITYLRRYSLAAFVGVAPDDDDDAQSAQPAAGQTVQRQPRQQTNGNGGGLKATDPAPKGLQDILKAELVRVYGPTVEEADAEARFEAMQFLERHTGKSSVEDLTVAEGNKIKQELRSCADYKEAVSA